MNNYALEPMFNSFDRKELHCHLNFFRQFDLFQSIGKDRFSGIVEYLSSYELNNLSRSYLNDLNLVESQIQIKRGIIKNDLKNIVVSIISLAIFHFFSFTNLSFRKPEDIKFGNVAKISIVYSIVNISKLIFKICELKKQENQFKKQVVFNHFAQNEIKNSLVNIENFEEETRKQLRSWLFN